MTETVFFKIAKALADPRRFEILKLIARNDGISCKEIVEKTSVAQPTVSHHIKILIDAGLVSMRRKGQHGFVTANLRAFNAYLSEAKARLYGAV